MKKRPQVASVVMLVVALTGCASPYMVDRRRDAADIVTATTGIGAGVKVQAGPVASGLSWMADTKGLRGGVIAKYPSGCGGWQMLDANVIVFGGESFDLLHSTAQSYGAENYETLEPRHKCYQAPCYLGLSIPRTLPGDTWCRGHLYRLTQIEVALGFWRTVRLGVNPGELLDFLLGWAGCDVFADDVGVLTKRPTTEEVLEKEWERQKARFQKER